MPDKKITDLTAITTIVDTDVLPIVDVDADETKKITISQVKAQSPVQSVNGSTGAVTVQETLVSGTNIKTINSTSLLGSGDITISGGSTDWGDIGGTLSNQTDLQNALDAKQATLVSGTNIKTVNSTSLVGSGDVSVQETLVSGTNIKTVNSQSLLGSGDISISASAAWGSITGTLSSQTDLQSALDAKVDENAAITGATKTKITYDSKGLVTAGADLAASDLPSAIDATKIADGSVTNTEFQYIGGLTSDAQTQIDGKQATITGAATTIDDTDLTASRALVSDGSGKVAVSDVTSTELGYLDGVTSAIQTQVDAKTPKLISLNAQTGTTYTLVLGDADKLVEMNNAAANTLTVPPNSSVAFSTGTQIIVVQKGAGTTTIAAGSGVTLLSKDSALGIGGQYGAATCIKIATDTWYVIGDLA